MLLSLDIIIYFKLIRIGTLNFFVDFYRILLLNLYFQTDLPLTESMSSNGDFRDTYNESTLYIIK